MILLFLAGMRDECLLAEQGRNFLPSSASRAEQLVRSPGRRLQILSTQPASIPMHSASQCKGLDKLFLGPLPVVRWCLMLNRSVGAGNWAKCSQKFGFYFCLSLQVTLRKTFIPLSPKFAVGVLKKVYWITLFCRYKYFLGHTSKFFHTKMLVTHQFSIPSLFKGSEVPWSLRVSEFGWQAWHFIGTTSSNAQNKPVRQWVVLSL